jgi:hypothetical protein
MNMNTMAEQNNDGIKLTPEQAKARRARNIALGFCIAGLCVLFFTVTIVRLGGAVLQRAM